MFVWVFFFFGGGCFLLFLTLDDDLTQLKSELVILTSRSETIVQSYFRENVSAILWKVKNFKCSLICTISV